MRKKHGFYVILEEGSFEKQLPPEVEYDMKVAWIGVFTNFHKSYVLYLLDNTTD